jgi:hypothetical protein
MPSFNSGDDVLAKTVESATDALHVAIEVSYGTPTMSDEDMKVAFLMTHRALQYQTLLNESLLDRLLTLEETSKKKLFRRK